MTKQNVKELLHNYSATGTELEFKNRMLSFLEMYENSFERSLEIGHFTASCWLLNKEGTHALLMHHAKLNQWFQLGGHCDGNPNVLQVAVKEAQEESGIMAIEPLHDQIFDIDIHLIPENRREKAHHHYDIRFLLQVVSSEQIIRNNEAHELRWISKNSDNLPSVNNSVMRMFNKWITRPWVT